MSRASVVIATYNQPRALALVIHGYAVQTASDFEIVVADDGSRPETAAVIDRLRDETRLDLIHVWHPDDGFRKTEILNRAILAATTEYLIFSDGDCIPRADFVETHLRLARPRTFLSGGYLKLPAAVSDAITVDDVRSGRVANPRWLRSLGWRPGRRALRLLDPGPLPALLDRLTPTQATWNGHNSSTWRDLALAANGFDLDMAYGGEDRAFGLRLVNAGIRGVGIRHRAPCLHLDHPRPYIDREALDRNRLIRERIIRERETRARLGIAELPPAAQHGDGG